MRGCRFDILHALRRAVLKLKQGTMSRDLAFPRTFGMPSQNSCEATTKTHSGQLHRLDASSDLKKWTEKSVTAPARLSDRKKRAICYLSLSSVLD